MNSAVQLKEVGFNGHIVVEPPEQACIVDHLGDEIHAPQAGIMVKIDAKVNERVELSKGTLALIALAPAVLMLIFNYGGSMIGWTRQDQEVRTKVDVMSKQMDGLNDKVDKLGEAMQQLQIKKAYELGAGTAHDNEKGDKK